MKGLSNDEATKDCNELLNLLNLKNKKNEMPSALSGGMKRKLCLGMALVGDPKVLVLDEPTSGLDVEARREIWDILLHSRSNKTTIITTHFMEEADVLGDRIGIMDHGFLICYGTPFFLKQKFGKFRIQLINYHFDNFFLHKGTGYQLTLTCKEDYREEAIEDLVKHYVTTAKFPVSRENEMKINLPLDNKGHYQKLFKALESKSEELGIKSIGLSATTVEDVFLK